MAETFNKKLAVLRAQFFPTADEADLIDLTGEGLIKDHPSREPSSLGNCLPMPRVIREDVTTVVRSLPKDKTLGVSSVPNSVLKIIGDPLIEAI